MRIHSNISSRENLLFGAFLNNNFRNTNSTTVMQSLTRSSKGNLDSVNIVKQNTITGNTVKQANALISSSYVKKTLSQDEQKTQDPNEYKLIKQVAFLSIKIDACLQCIMGNPELLNPSVTGTTPCEHEEISSRADSIDSIILDFSQSG